MRETEERKESLTEIACLISRNIKRLRQNKGYSQAELANKMATHQACVAQLESGRKNYKLETLVKAAGALDCDLVDLFQRKASISLTMHYEEVHLDREEHVTLVEAARLTGLTHATLYARLCSKRLKAFKGLVPGKHKMNKQWLIPRSELERLLDDSTSKAV